MKSIQEIIFWLQEEIEEENQTLKELREERQTNNHAYTGALSARDALLRTIEFIEEQDL